MLELHTMKKSLVIIALIFLTGCPGGTAYKPMGFTGGFSEVQIAKNRYKISYRGNALVGSDKVENRAMLRAADFTLELGKDLFAIIQESNKQRLSGDSSGNVYTKHGTTLEIKVFNFNDYFPNTMFSKEQYKELIEKRNNSKGDTNLYIAEDVAKYLSSYR